MAEVRWIRITTNMFDDEKIKLIDAMPERDTVFYIWIRLLVQAGKTNAGGYIFLSENVPYTDEMFSTLFNRPLNTVRLALQTLKNFGMIEESENVLKITNWSKHQNIEGLEKIKEQNRIRQQRKRLKDYNADPIMARDNYTCQYCGQPAIGVDHIIPITENGSRTDESNMVACCKRCNQIKMTQKLTDFLNNNLGEGFLNLTLILSNQILKRKVKFENSKFVSCHVTTCDSHATELDKELELDIDKDKELLQEQEEKNSGNSDFNIFIYMQERGFVSISPVLMEKIQADVEIYSLEEVKKAIEIADENGVHKYSYVKAVIEKRRAGVNEKTNAEVLKKKAREEFLNDKE